MAIFLVRKSSICIIAVIASIAIWYLGIIPELEKIPDDYQRYAEQEGTNQIISHVGGNLSQPFIIRESFFQNVNQVNGSVLTISSTIKGLDSSTGKVVFYDVKQYHVDRYTKALKDKPNELYAFSPWVQKHDYPFFHPLVFADAPLVYKKTDYIDGLEVYLFEARTVNVDDTSAFPQFQGIKISSDTNSSFWIEPITGDLVKFKKTWHDSQVLDNGSKRPVEIGGKETTDYSIFILSQRAQADRQNIVLLNFFVPILFVAITIVTMIILALQNGLRQSKDLLIKNEKLAVIGSLAARISHDLRNPLSIIKNEVKLMTVQFPDDEKIKEKTERLSRAIDRMDRQINDVMDFVRLRDLDKKRFSSEDLMKSVLKNTVIPEGIKITYITNDMSVFGDFVQIETVLSNMITNSIHAIGMTGEIKVSFETTYKFTIIKIEDSGPGIPKENLDKIFEPLFTTKQVGTGLGLSSCKSIIENHGGKITVENNPTTFTIYLPKH